MNFKDINLVLWGEQTCITPPTIQMSVKFWHPYIVSFQTLASLPNFSRSFQRHGWIFQTSSCQSSKPGRRVYSLNNTHRCGRRIWNMDLRKTVIISRLLYLDTRFKLPNVGAARLRSPSGSS